MPRSLLVVENASVPTDPRVWPECLALRDAGWDVAVVCPRGTGDEQASAETVDGVEIRRFDLPESAGGARGYVTEYTRALWSIARLARRLGADARFDVVHASTPPDVLLLATLPLRRAGAATILDHHDLGPELYEAKFGKRGPAHRALGLAERLGFALADVVVSTNASFREVALTRGGKAPEDVFVVRNGPDPAVFRAVDPDPDLRRGAPHLLGYVGRMGLQDGVLEAIDVLERLRAQRTDWHAVFAGDGEALEPARRRVDAAGLDGHVTFLGFVSDRRRVVEVISSCDVCLSPEPRNALNDHSTLIKVAEYMSVGRPVVAFDLAETRRTAGDAAVLAADLDGFVDALSGLLDDPERRRAMGTAGRERVVAELSWERSVPVLLEAYERALEIRRGSARG